MELSQQQRNEFSETLWSFYAQHARDLPWREPDPDSHFDPYSIMVSELMLQQTQVSRVMLKYAEFLQRFPTVQALALAEQGDVLRVWQGLGYNRRAKFLWQAARIVAQAGHFPDTLAELVTLPGVGTNTAGAILSYAYNRPAVFIETNVRTVYIHHFFHDRIDVTDKEIVAVLEQTLDRENPRDFYWAIMDYGSHLKTTIGNLNRASRHYTRQSTFKGSRRQIRGRIIFVLGSGNQTLPALQAAIPDARLEGVIDDLVAEGMVRSHDGVYSL